MRDGAVVEMICWVCHGFADNVTAVCTACRQSAGELLRRDYGESTDTGLLAELGHRDTVRLARSLADDPAYSDRF